MSGLQLISTNLFADVPQLCQLNRVPCAGADLDQERRLTGSTPLYVACWGGLLDVVQLLVALGSDRKHVNYFGLRPDQAVRALYVHVCVHVRASFYLWMRACVHEMRVSLRAYVCKLPWNQARLGGACPDMFMRNTMNSRRMRARGACVRVPTVAPYVCLYSHLYALHGCLCTPEYPLTLYAAPLAGSDRRRYRSVLLCKSGLPLWRIGHRYVLLLLAGSLELPSSCSGGVLILTT